MSGLGWNPSYSPGGIDNFWLLQDTTPKPEQQDQKTPLKPPGWARGSGGATGEAPGEDSTTARRAHSAPWEGGIGLNLFRRVNNALQG